MGPTHAHTHTHIHRGNKRRRGNEFSDWCNSEIDSRCSLAESLPGHTLRVVRLSLAVSQVVFVCFFVTGFYWVLLGFYLVDRECGIDSFSLIFFCTSFSLLYLEEHP